jgi:hypothetical protein
LLIVRIAADVGKDDQARFLRVTSLD